MAANLAILADDLPLRPRLEFDRSVPVPRVVVVFNSGTVNAAVQAAVLASVESTAFTIATAVAGVVGAAESGRNTLGKLSDALDGHAQDATNPHGVSKTQVGLGNVANLAPADLPISDAVAAALGTKATPADIATAVSQLTAGSPAELNTFLEAYNRFLAGEGALSTLTGLVAAKADEAATSQALGLKANTSDLGTAATKNVGVAGGVAAAGENADITSLSGLVAPIDTKVGGTGLPEALIRYGGSGQFPDNTAAIQDRINLLTTAASGGQVMIPEGKYYVDELVLPCLSTSTSNTRIRFVGMGRGSILVPRRAGMTALLKIQGGQTDVANIHLVDENLFCQDAILFDPTSSVDVNFDLRLTNSQIAGFVYGFHGRGRSQSWNISKNYFLNNRGAAIFSENDGRNSSITDNQIYNFGTGGDGIIFDKASGGVQPEGVRISNNLTLTPGGKPFDIRAGLSIHITNNVFDQIGGTGTIDGTVNGIADVHFLANWIGPKAGFVGKTCEVKGNVQSLTVTGGSFVSFGTGLHLNGSAVQRVTLNAARYRIGGSASLVTDANLRVSGARIINVIGCLFEPTTAGLGSQIIEDDNTSACYFTGNTWQVNPTQRSSASIYERNWGDDLSVATGDKGRKVLLNAGSSTDMALRFSAAQGLYAPSTDAWAFLSGSATRFFIAPNGTVGVGAFSPTDLPAVPLHVRSGAGTIVTERTSSDTVAARNEMRKSRGGAAVLAGDGLAVLRGAGYDGSAWLTGGEFTIEAAAAPAAGVLTGRARLRVVSAAGTTTDAFVATAATCIWNVPQSIAGRTFANLPTTGNTNGDAYRVSDRFNRTAKWYAADSTWRWEDTTVAT